MSERLPEIWIERNDSDMPNALWPDRNFWRYLFAGLAMQGMLVRDSLYQTNAVNARRQADALLAELEREQEPSDG